MLAVPTPKYGTHTHKLDGKVMNIPLRVVRCIGGVLQRQLVISCAVGSVQCATDSTSLRVAGLGIPKSLELKNLYKNMK
jgi:hypothetical protein